MAKKINKLSPRLVASIKEPGLYSDGLNLYLRVTAALNKNYVFKYTRNGKTHEIGLGSERKISLARAREKAKDYIDILDAGLDPLAEKRKRDDADKQQAKILTFRQCAEQYIEAKRSGWKNPKHVQQWQNTLSQYAYPVIGDTPIAEVSTELVLRVLSPIWNSKNETASRLRGRIENVLDWAAVQGFRSRENPAAWKGHLSNLLPAPAKVQKPEHFKAVDYRELPDLMTVIRKNQNLSARALEILILTAARTNEVIGATWDEINLNEKLWTIPGERMKAGKEHRIPLCNRAVEILKFMRLLSHGDYVFAGRSAGGRMSTGTMDTFLQRTLGVDATVHGFRSSFRDWASEETSAAHEVCEMALAHTIKNKAESAYRRGDLLDKRRALMVDCGALNCFTD